MRLSGYHALITGGGTGIGAAIARALAAEGAALTLVGRRREPLEAVAAELGTAVAVADVTDRAAVDRAVGEARGAHGAVDILIANAGAAQSAPFAKTSAEQWREAMAVNLDGVFHCCQAALPDLLASDAGRIVTIASTAGLQGYAYTAAYTAAKHGAVGLMRALAAEYAGKGLTANAVCPGFTDTDLVADAAAQIHAKTGRSVAEARDQLARLNPGGRLIRPEDVAKKVLWLCLPEQQNVTGQAIVTDGSDA
ncbi:MAG: SDR family oxidoreductase [Sphingomonas sp.]|uniref:SDR family NAD(P)-dependent oxidoreductase n=1 Tax=Sphingomonas sp. TaxID=28214 RepID=UPI001200BD75|nr:SDR family oxidoreductase [Sphingomonas sp.]THD37279.1 MAG: SDR family oxidoreductase [Sphingomonas sp.]